MTIVKLDFPGGFGGFSTLSVPADSTITKLIIKIDGITALPTSRIKDQNGKETASQLNVRFVLCCVNYGIIEHFYD